MIYPYYSVSKDRCTIAVFMDEDDAWNWAYQKSMKTATKCSVYRHDSKTAKRVEVKQKTP